MSCVVVVYNGTFTFTRFRLDVVVNNVVVSNLPWIALYICRAQLMLVVTSVCWVEKPQSVIVIVSVVGN